jgi:hypothetical protein
MPSNYRKVKDNVEGLKRENIISETSARNFIRKGDREVAIPSLDDAAYDPIFTCIVIDQSGSMESCVNALLDSHPRMLDALRESAVTRNGAHFVSQYLFSGSITTLQDAEALSVKHSSDKVTVLTINNYKLKWDGTALYDTLFDVLQDMLTLLQEARNEGLSPKLCIAVITDGEDNVSKTDPANIRRLIEELKTKKILLSSVLVALNNGSFSSSAAAAIRETIGFDKILNCNQSSPREIREAFILASQSLNAQMQ